MVEAYVALQEEETGQKFGSTKLWNAILGACREKDPGFKNEDLEGWLKRQHLEFWLDRGTEPKDGAFRFIDRFVRRLVVGEFGGQVRQILKVEEQNRIARGLREIFLVWEDGDEGQKLADNGTLFVFRAVRGAGEKRSQCAFRVTETVEGVLCADLLLAPLRPETGRDHAICDAEWYRGNAHIWRAYFVPHLSEDPNSQDYDSIRGSVFACNTEGKLGSNPFVSSRKLFRFVMLGRVVFINNQSGDLEQHLKTKSRHGIWELEASFRQENESVFDYAFQHLSSGYL
ncbi:hypothetical protein [Roseovarius sp. D22-M7]|uniref:hypothetical protein n=1 Tax=Roseovarius sp. D22-M7 TaxID=3127116 RepID=UPI00300FBB94